MKGDITIRPVKDRDARLERIARHHSMTMNQVIGLAAHQISLVPAALLYQCLSAITERADELRKHRPAKPRTPGEHQ